MKSVVNLSARKFTQYHAKHLYTHEEKLYAYSQKNNNKLLLEKEKFARLPNFF